LQKIKAGLKNLSNGGSKPKTATASKKVEPKKDVVKPAAGKNSFV
jgi:hypothetical protein